MEFTPEQQAAVDKIVTERVARERDTREKEYKEKLDQVKAEHATQLKELQIKVTESEAKLKDADTWKASHEKLPAIQQQLDETAAKLKSTEGAGTALNETLEKFRGMVPEENKRRLPEGLTPDKELQWLAANSDLVFGKALGNTPPGDTTQPAPKGELIAGKYTSEAEFMKADPAGFIQYAQKHPAQGGWEQKTG